MLYNDICPIDQQDKLAKQTYSGLRLHNYTLSNICFKVQI